MNPAPNNRVQELIKKYDIHPPFIQKATPVHFYTVDFVQGYWKYWGDYAGFYYRLYLFAIRNNYVDVFYFPDSFAALRQHYFGLLEKDPTFLDKHYTDWQASCRRLNEDISTFESALADNNKRDATKFAKIFTTYRKMAEEYLLEYGLSGTPQEAFGFQPELWINPEIEAYCKKYDLEYQKTSAILASPVTLSFIAEEELELLKIAMIKAKTGGTDDDDKKNYQEMLNTHQQKWFWMRNNYVTIETLPLSFFEERINKWVEGGTIKIQAKIDKIGHTLETRKEEKRALFAAHAPSEKLMLYVKITEIFADMQDIRKGLVLKLNHYHKLFLEQVAEHFSKPLDDLWYYSYREMMKAVETETFLPDLEIGERRKIIVAGESKDEKIILTGKEAQEMLNYLEHKVDDVAEFKGLVAHTGKITGKVKIVLKVADISKVDNGDILVSSMTRPEMTAAMQKAGAFVTDEGGITCHAAIIARELKKPCIIGTKIATKVLHDGDTVEVDADKGVVKILNHAK